MKKLVLDFHLQLQEAIAIGEKFGFSTPKRDFSNILVTGLGGSGIGASIVQNYVFDKLSIPFVVNKDYFLPKFVGKDTLLIVCSYSGNTEETLSAMEQGIECGATVVGVTSGGKVAEICKSNGFDCILVPSGMPPRACLGYSLVQLLFVLHHFGLIDNGYELEHKNSIALLQSEETEIQKLATDLSARMLGKLPIVYSAQSIEGVAVRFRQQLNENSKLLGWSAAIPEMNHNELVGWKDMANDTVVVILRNDDDYERTQARMEINKKVYNLYTDNIIEIYSKGASYLECAFYLIHLTDWISVILADMRQLDATEVKVIDFLKAELATLK